MVVNEYGAGKAVFFGFDMTDITPSPLMGESSTPISSPLMGESSTPISSPLMGEGKCEGDIKQYLINAVSYATPETTLVHPGATIPVEIAIKNLSPEQRLNTVEIIPGDFTIVAALDSGIVSGPTITWNFLLQQDSSAYLNSIIQLPNESFTDTILAEISYLSL